MSTNRATLRVLVADDSAEVADRITETLRDSLDAEILGPAGDGAEALELFERHSPDVVVLDFAMPRMTGLQALRSIRERDRHVLVIIITAHDDHSIEVACMQAGADHFVNKFDGLDRLVDLLAAYTRR